MTWDAETYNRISSIQESWGRKVIEWRHWKGSEKVLDAGCGTGNLTRILAKRVPLGIIYAVDIDSNMIQTASCNLKEMSNVKLIESDLSTVDLPTKVDVTFSNATIHWILDHRRLFENFWKLLEDGGEMVIQCGGHGNLKKVLSVIDRIMLRDEFAPFFSNWKEAWYFPKPNDTSSLLHDIGFKNIEAHLVNEPTQFSERNSFALFAKTIVMKPHLAILPSERLKDQFMKEVLDEIDINHKSMSWVMDYVRLNIKARKN